jgi:hypothetical protein
MYVSKKYMSYSSCLYRTKVWLIKTNKKILVCCHSTAVMHQEILDSCVYRKQDEVVRERAKEEKKNCRWCSFHMVHLNDLLSRTMLSCLRMIASCSHRIYIYPFFSFIGVVFLVVFFFFLFVCYCCTEGKSEGGTKHHLLQNFLLLSLSLSVFFLKKKDDDDDGAHEGRRKCICVYISGLRRSKHKTGTLKKKKKKKGRREIIIWIKLWLHDGSGTLQKYSSHSHSYSRFQSLCTMRRQKEHEGENIGAWQQHTSCLPALCTDVSYLV